MSHVTLLNVLSTRNIYHVPGAVVVVVVVMVIVVVVCCSVCVAVCVAKCVAVCCGVMHVEHTWNA